MAKKTFITVVLLVLLFTSCLSEKGNIVSTDYKKELMNEYYTQLLDIEERKRAYNNRGYTVVQDRVSGNYYYQSNPAPYASRSVGVTRSLSTIQEERAQKEWEEEQERLKYINGGTAPVEETAPIQQTTPPQNQQPSRPAPLNNTNLDESTNNTRQYNYVQPQETAVVQPPSGGPYVPPAFKENSYVNHPRRANTQDPLNPQIPKPAVEENNQQAPTQQNQPASWENTPTVEETIKEKQLRMEHDGFATIPEESPATIKRTYYFVENTDSLTVESSNSFYQLVDDINQERVVPARIILVGYGQDTWSFNPSTDLAEHRAKALSYILAKNTNESALYRSGNDSVTNQPRVDMYIIME